MFRWNNIADQEIFGMTVKMYRDPFVAKSTFISPIQGLELDHYAFRFFGSELYMYRILDTNFERYMEERGDLSRIGQISIPSVEDISATIL
jgi:hypothetical protein